MLDVLLWFFIGCLIGSIALVIRGFVSFKDPLKARNWFFFGGLGAVIPVVIIGIVIYLFLNSMMKHLYIPIVVEIILIICLFAGRFGMSEDADARKTTMISALFLITDLLYVMWFYEKMIPFIYREW